MLSALQRATAEAHEAEAAVVRAQSRAKAYQYRCLLDEEIASTACGSTCGGMNMTLPMDTSPSPLWVSGTERVTFFSHMREPWDERIDWYLGSVKQERKYSRRELALDFYIHSVGLILAILGCVAIANRLAVRKPPQIMIFSVCLYAVSLVSMLACSLLFNSGQAYWYNQRWTLRSLDHAGICLLIVGTYTPTMAVACTMRTMAFVWTIGIVSTAIKWSRGSLDRTSVHLVFFLAMGWACVLVWEHLTNALSSWATQLVLIGGSIYTIGLIPWALLKPMEYHICVWHTFVIVASGCFFAVVYVEILGIDHPDCGWRIPEVDEVQQAAHAVAREALTQLNLTNVEVI